MYNIVEQYMNKLSLYDVLNFASKKKVILSNEEASFILQFLKKNWFILLKEQDISVLDKYKDYFSSDNYLKIKDLLIEYKTKYGKLFR